MGGIGQIPGEQLIRPLAVQHDSHAVSLASRNTDHWA